MPAPASTGKPGGEEMRTSEVQSHRSSVVMSRSRLDEAVRRALRIRRPVLCLSAGLLVASAASVQPVSAAAFPALLELSTLDPSNGGDGSVGVILRGIS